MTTQTQIDQLAALLDGTLVAGEVPRSIARLAELAGTVSSHTVVAVPTAAFREALRTQLLNSVAPAASGGAAAGAHAGASGASAAGFGSTVTSVVAAISAAAVLVGAGVTALAPAAVPGDALYDAKRLIEAGQLRVAGLDGEAELLLTFATERVLEAVGLVDTADIDGLLDESQRHLRDALALLDGLPAADASALLESFTSEHLAALNALLEQSPSVEVVARIGRLLTQTDTLVADWTNRDDTTGGTGVGDGLNGDAPGQGGTGVDDGGSTGGDVSPGPGGTVDDLVDDGVDGGGTVDDTVGDVIDDVVNGVDDVVDDVVDHVGGVLDGVGVPRP